MDDEDWPYGEMPTEPKDQLMALVFLLVIFGLPVLLIWVVSWFM